MRTIKIAFSSVLAACVLGAFAAPALADEFYWAWEGLPIESETPKDVDLEGEVTFLDHGRFIYCEVKGEATLGGEGSGEITEFGASDCEAGGAPWCELDSMSSTVPWVVCPRFRRHLTAWVERLRQGGVDATHQEAIPTRVSA